MRSSKINRTRLRTAVLILFLLQTLMLPAAIGVTYASRSLKPEHILTYSAGRLVWDAGTDTDSSGAARLRLFDTAYSHVDSGDGAEVVAPGTEGHSLVRLKNDGGSAVTYTAVQDQADTALGDSAAAGRAARVTLGFYLVVSEEPGQWIRPDEYKTGDGFPLGWYVGMMAVTGGALAVLGTGGRRRRGDEDEKGGQTGR